MGDRFLVDGPKDAPATILFAHGAGAPMDSPAMAALAKAMADAGLRVARFEFGYMASRRTSDGRKPPPRAETLIPEYRAAITAIARKPLIIGGKSMGGRVASMIADEAYAAGLITGLVCVGYPFHPPGKPAQLRTRHLINLRAPTLICQGTRDPFGSREEVLGYGLSDQIGLLWLEDGDHDLKPRKAVSGFGHAEHLRTVGSAVAAWARDLGGEPRHSHGPDTRAKTDRTESVRS